MSKKFESLVIKKSIEIYKKHQDVVQTNFLHKQSENLIVSAMFTETDTLKWADSFCRISRYNYVNINHSEFKPWSHF